MKFPVLDDHVVKKIHRASADPKAGTDGVRHQRGGSSRNGLHQPAVTVYFCDRSLELFLP